MADYDNTNSGALFKNDKKESDKSPDYKGSINVGGTDYWLSAWFKVGKSGAKFMSLSVKAKDAPKAAKPVPKAAPKGSGGGFDDQDIPFAQHERRMIV